MPKILIKILKSSFRFLTKLRAWRNIWTYGPHWGLNVTAEPGQSQWRHFRLYKFQIDSHCLAYSQTKAHSYFMGHQSFVFGPWPVGTKWYIFCLVTMEVAWDTRHFHSYRAKVTSFCADRSGCRNGVLMSYEVWIGLNSVFYRELVLTDIFEADIGWYFSQALNQCVQTLHNFTTEVLDSPE